MGKNDSIMIDRDLLISNYLENIGASLNILPLLNCGKQLRKAEMKESQAVGSVKICQISNTTC